MWRSLMRSLLEYLSLTSNLTSHSRGLCQLITPHHHSIVAVHSRMCVNRLGGILPVVVGIGNIPLTTKIPWLKQYVPPCSQGLRVDNPFSADSEPTGDDAGVSGAAEGDSRDVPSAGAGADAGAGEVAAAAVSSHAMSTDPELEEVRAFRCSARVRPAVTVFLALTHYSCW